MRLSMILFVPALTMAPLLAGCDKPASSPAQDNVTATAAAPASPDEVASAEQPAGPAKGIDRSHKGEAAPAHGFAGPDGRPVTMAAFRGRPVLVNLWATWCAPCVKELPTLDALAARSSMGGGVRVVALSQDTDAAKAKAFLAGKGFKALAGYTDPKMQWLGGMATNLPTTILYDAQGKEVWRWLGEADWTGAKATEALAEI